MKKLLPLVLLFIGLGAGVGAGIFMRPERSEDLTSTTSPTQNASDLEEVEIGDHFSDAPETVRNSNEYAKLNNQFVIPIIASDKVTALVVLALSIEVPEGKTDLVYLREPKLRDSFLQVLFDHANVGGFEGNFTDASALRKLRTALKEIAQRDLGKEIASDVLIIEIARQDY